MFEVSLVELAVIALVALLVLGPEKLPRAARTAGLYLRKARASWYSIRSDIERELAAEDLKSALKDTRRQLRSSAQEIGDGLQPSPASTKTASATPASEPAAAQETAAPDTAPEPADDIEPPLPAEAADPHAGHRQRDRHTP